jgi:hypothetical protein
MPNYQNGQIYSIRSNTRPDLIYVGSTCRRLSERFGKHKVSTNTTTSKQIIEIGDAYIELIEIYPCNSKQELNRREGELIRSMNCVNKLVAGRTIEEYRQSEQCKHIAKKYRASDHGKQIEKKYRASEQCKLITKKYRESDHGKQTEKKYRESDHGKQTEKKYRESEKAKVTVAAYAAKKKECECGAITSQRNSVPHRKTNKHSEWQRIYDFIMS